MPKTGGLSLSNVPRPHFPLSRFRRPLRPLFCTTSGCPLWPATTYASSHSTSFDNVTVGFFYDAFTQGSRHLLDIAAIHVQLVGNVVVGHIQPHEIQTQNPHFQGLMMSHKNGVCQIIKACIAVVTPGVDFSSGRAGIAARIRYAFGTPSRSKKRGTPDAMPQRQ